jgi:hypothetical protein
MGRSELLNKGGYCHHVLPPNWGEPSTVRVPLGPCPSRGRIILDAEHGIGLSAHY